MPELPPIPESLIAAVRRTARARGRSRGLTGANLDDHEGDALLALVLLALEWDPTRNVPIEAFVMSHLDRRTTDIARQRLPGLRSGRRYAEVLRSPIAADGLPTLDRPAPEPPDVDDTFIWAAAATDQERTLLAALKAGAQKQEAARILEVTPGRVSQLLAKIRSRLSPATPATTRTRRPSPG